MIRQGEVRTLAGTRARVLVVSKDSINGVAYPVVVQLERGNADVPGMVIPFADQDPMGGVVIVNKVAFLHPNDLGEVVGTITGATLMDVVSAVRALFEVE